MPLPDILEFVGTNVTQTKFKQAQAKLLDYVGGEVPTKKYVDELALKSNKGVKNFATEALLKAYVPTVEETGMFAYAWDVKNTFEWKNGAWESVGPSELDLAKDYVNDQVKTKELTTEILSDVVIPGSYSARYTSTAALERDYPVEMAGILSVSRYGTDQIVYQTYKTIDNVTYSRVFKVGEVVDWVKNNGKDTAFCQMFVNPVIFDFSEITSYQPAKINTPLELVHSSYGSSRLTRVSTNSKAIAKFKNGTVALSGQDSANTNRLDTNTPLLKSLNSTLAFSFSYKNTARASIIWQHKDATAGRLQISMNAEYTGTGLAEKANCLQVFLNGVTGGAGVNGMIAAKALKPDVLHKVILALSDQAQASKLYINGELVDTFTATSIADVNNQVLGYTGASIENISIHKILAVQETVDDYKIQEINTWLGKSNSESNVDDEDSSYIDFISLTSSKTAGAVIVPSDGIFNEDLLLYLQNQTHVAKQASLTKVIASMVLLDNETDLNAVIQRTSEDPNTGSGANLNVGDQITVYDALRNLMLPSSNVTANIIGRIYGGKLLESEGVVSYTYEQAINRWVTELNVKATQIGMTKTIFSTPSGLDNGSVSQNTSIIDMLKMFCYATKYDALMDAWSMPTYDMPVTSSTGVSRIVSLTTTVVPLKDGDDYVFGGKTGTLNSYGYNLGEIAIMPDGRKIAIVLMGASSDADRASDARTILNEIVTSYSWFSIPRKAI